MTRLHGFDRYYADTLSTGSYQNSVPGAQAMLVEQPNDFDRGIALSYGAGDCSRTVDVEGFLPEFEWHDDRENYARDMGIWEGVIISIR